MSKLTRDAIETEIANVTSLLDDAPQDDQIARFQLTRRLGQLKEELERLGNVQGAPASLAILFSGKPVIGSRAIDADFAGKAIDYIQTLISKQLAAKQLGQLPSRGPIRFSQKSPMAITGVAHHSFGFIMEEMPDNESWLETQLTPVVREIVSLLARSGAEDLSDFEQAIEETDPRQLPTMRDLFRLLDDRGAKLTLVDDSQERYLDDFSIHRARQRVDAVEIKDLEDQEVSGLLLGILPAARKFEMRLDSSQEVIHGSVSLKFSREFLEQLISTHEDVLGRRWLAIMRIREISEPNRPIRRVYALQRLANRLD